MAIQIPNPGTGNGASGDNEFVLWSKVKDNFSDQTNAASRLVGEETGNVLVVGSFGLIHSPPSLTSEAPLSSTSTWGFSKVGVSGAAGAELRGGSSTANNVSAVLVLPYQKNENAQLCIPIGRNNTPNQMFFRGASGANPNGWSEVYHTSNTTKDTATGFLKASSPVLHVYNDKIDKIHEAEKLDITVDKKGVGHYEIHGTTGLRKNDGWFMSPPRDVHGNVLCMVDLDEKDGVVILKTYKKKFDFETVSIVHDYDNPMDIPEGVCVEFRFNDLLYDNLDDTQTEV